MKRASPAVIGAFVVGAVILAVAAVLVFGGGEFFRTKRYFVTYFDGSVKGLRVGSNVLFRGVRVGYVTDIRIMGNQQLTEFTVPVVYQLLPDAFTVNLEDGGTTSLADLRRTDLRQALVDRGLRARLEVESYVTGQLVIQLDFYPGPVTRARSRDDIPYPEIPSVPSNVQQMLEDLQRFVAEIQSKVDLGKLATDLQGTLAGANQLANSAELRQAITGIERLVNARQTQRLPADLEEAIATLQTTLGETRALVRRADAGLGPALDEAGPALVALRRVLEDASRVMEQARVHLAGDSEVAWQLARTLEQTQAVARSLRALSDYLERHPEALLRGKGDGGTER